MRRSLISLIMSLVSLVFLAGLVVFIASTPGHTKSEAVLLAHASSGQGIYVGRGNFLQTLFREPFETAVFLYDDYSFVTWTTQEDHRVGGSVEMIAEYLDDIGKPLPLVRDIIHNHLTPSRFSERDIKSYYQYRAAGFRGRYGIYYPHSKSILWKED